MIHPLNDTASSIHRQRCASAGAHDAWVDANHAWDSQLSTQYRAVRSQAGMY